MEKKRAHIIVGMKRLSWVVAGFACVFTALLYSLIEYEPAEGIVLGVFVGIIVFFLIRGITWSLQGFYFGKDKPEQ